MGTGFAARAADGDRIWLYTRKEEKAGARMRDVRWGDFLSTGESDADGWTEIKWRTEDGFTPCFIRTEHVVATRPLELIFVDVGQGDGCMIVSPETGANERIMLVDAGEQDNMMRFAKWRFGDFERDFTFHAAVLTHSDTDHYLGFQPFFSHPKIHFDRVYHNGLAEREGADLFGASDATKKYLVEPAVTHDDIAALYADPAVRGGKKYPKLIHTALSGGRVGRVEMLSAKHGASEGGKSWMPGFAPSDGRATTIEVLGPVPETLPNGDLGLRWFAGKDNGKTKNGHSVLLRLQIGGLSVLLGGDLNLPAEDYLLRHYGEIGPAAPLAQAIAKASTRLGADIMKSCHHGSADVTNEFLESVKPFAFVVSSGEDGWAHPRPDLIGRLGKHGRDPAPIILCTEMLRSTREEVNAKDFKRLRDLDRIVDAAETTPADRAAAKTEREKLEKTIRRNVAVYGAITVRTDGDALEVTHRLEAPQNKYLWQTYSFLREANGQWRALEDSSH